MGTKRILVIADGHSGHNVGLTPPDWWTTWPKSNPRQQKIAAIQRETWKWFAGEVDRFKPFTHLFYVGDALDGKGAKTGGTEQKSADRGEQTDMAANVIDYSGAPTVLIVPGTMYHVGPDEDWEREIIPKLKSAKKAHFEGHAFPVINGVQFDVKHFIGNSAIPHGRFTALARDKLWNIMWSYHDRQPDSKIILRAHVHEYRCIEEEGWTAIICPALQGYGSKFGARICSGTVNIGIIIFDVEADGTWHKTVRLAQLPHQRVHPLQL